MDHLVHLELLVQMVILAHPVHRVSPVHKVVKVQQANEVRKVHQARWVRKVHQDRVVLLVFLDPMVQVENEVTWVILDQMELLDRKVKPVCLDSLADQGWTELLDVKGKLEHLATKVGQDHLEIQGCPEIRVNLDNRDREVIWDHLVCQAKLVRPDCLAYLERLDSLENRVRWDRLVQLEKMVLAVHLVPWVMKVLQDLLDLQPCRTER